MSTKGAAFVVVDYKLLSTLHWKLPSWNLKEGHNWNLKWASNWHVSMSLIGITMENHQSSAHTWIFWRLVNDANTTCSAVFISFEILLQFTKRRAKRGEHRLHFTSVKNVSLLRIPFVRLDAKGFVCNTLHCHKSETNTNSPLKNLNKQEINFWWYHNVTALITMKEQCSF